MHCRAICNIIHMRALLSVGTGAFARHRRARLLACVCAVRSFPVIACARAHAGRALAGSHRTHVRVTGKRCPAGPPTWSHAWRAPLRAPLRTLSAATAVLLSASASDASLATVSDTAAIVAAGRQRQNCGRRVAESTAESGPSKQIDESFERERGRES